MRRIRQGDLLRAQRVVWMWQRTLWAHKEGHIRLRGSAVKRRREIARAYRGLPSREHRRLMAMGLHRATARERRRAHAYACRRKSFELRGTTAKERQRRAALERRQMAQAGAKLKKRRPQVGKLRRPGLPNSAQELPVP